MANYYCDDHFSEYTTSSDSDEGEGELEKKRWRRTYPGATGFSLGHLMAPGTPPRSPPPPVSSSKSEDQLCIGLKRGAEIAGRDLYCKAYQNFLSQIKTTQSTYHFLDPALSRQFVKGTKFDMDASGMVMLQGALINAMANWEEFIIEILKECFVTFVEVGSGRPPTLHSLKKSLPSCDAILRKELRQSCQTKPADETVYNLLWTINAPPQYVSRVSPWAEYFESYSQSTVTGAQLVPVFNPGAANSIDTLFTKLFQVVDGRSSLSEQILAIGRFRFKLRLNQDDELDLSIHSVAALRNISRLYYALRCVFAHGHNQKTITGALKDFPRNVAEFELGNERAAKYFLGLYRRMEKYGRDTSISYLTFVNMMEFLKRAAFFLMRALAKWVYDSTDTCIWSYKPHT
jgi:hypothetical protein